jgi:hypothetical protein
LLTADVKVNWSPAHLEELLMVIVAAGGVVTAITMLLVELTGEVEEQKPALVYIVQVTRCPLARVLVVYVLPLVAPGAPTPFTCQE